MAAAERYNANQFLAFGLDIVGFERWEFMQENANIDRFTNAFGAKPITCEQMWSDLVTMDPPLRILADGIYSAEEESDIISTKNEFDPYDIEEFKDRALSRQEKFNLLLKKWDVLHTMFRHDQGDFLVAHRSCMEAVTAIALYQLDNGSYSLFDPYPDPS
ncbi:hypothetical protein SEMRO_1262_G257090.1 [Seminavis robusta]|uniref:Uncharacterized protein n=1 Tax=Seminavis robusta TaxID=568900 RepID=A0A9N8EN46_9STRA|nr:hypothetical protein SEMRO_1262_G257090.1 [Seminavis robusta]|eukprot:Sro1262_g257090.1 n/a (160) ;mRNA; f:3824-4496